MSLVQQWMSIERSFPEGRGSAQLRLSVPDESDFDRAAALLGPANPGRRGKVLSVSVAGRGPGQSPGLMRRLLERLDAEGTRGTVRVLRALSDSRPVQTQGPVWHVGGKSV